MRALSIVFGCALLMPPAARPQAAREHRDVVFATVGGKDLGLDIYLPAGVESPSLLVWVHGGAWTTGTKAQVPKVFVANGIATASVDFRQSTEARFPAAVHDIKAAIRFLRAKGPEYGYRTDRIAIAGSSSGGHLAALVGVTNGHQELEGTVGQHLKESSAVQAILVYYGASNLATILAQSTPFGLNMRRPALERFLGALPENARDLAELASPVAHVDRTDPPLLLLHGDQDPQMPINQAHELEGAYKRLRLDVQLDVAHGAAHGGARFFEAEHLERALAFLRRTIGGRAGSEVEVAAAVAFTEGPTVDREGNVYFTELVSERIMKVTPAGVMSVFRERSNYANGLLIDPEGRLVAAEGGESRRTGVPVRGKPQVTRTDLRSGKSEVLADGYEGKPFTSPNDVTIDGRGRLYFTDLPGGAVYRIDAPGRLARILAAPEIERPNGIQVSPDDKTLYLVEANQAAGGTRAIRAYDLQADGTVRNMRIHYNFYPGRSADGMSIDTEGNLYAAAGLHRPRGTSETLDTKCGVHVISPAGSLLRFIPIPEDTITNTAFGGPDMKTLYVTAGKTLYKVRTDIAGLPR